MVSRNPKNGPTVSMHLNGPFAAKEEPINLHDIGRHDPYKIDNYPVGWRRDGLPGSGSACDTPGGLRGKVKPGIVLLVIGP
jgi:hypothetical protein